MKQEGICLKRKLLSGENSDLQPNKRKCSDYFPNTVKEIAEKCWRKDCTVVEPGKRSRPKADIKDGNEHIPAIYQTVTDKEAYALFEDMYKEEVRKALIRDCDTMRETLRKDQIASYNNRN